MSDPRITRDLLLLIPIVVPRSEIRRWMPTQVAEAEKWAARVHLRASDNIVRVPPKSKFLERYSA
jgi:hypothetical protein